MGKYIKLLREEVRNKIKFDTNLNKKCEF